MIGERRDVVCEVFDQVLAAEPGLRGERLRDLCGESADLFREVGSLLEHYRDDDPFLDFMQSSLLMENPISPVKGVPEVGQRIDKYEIMDVIGRGGMGTVFRARRVDDYEKQVALKVIHHGMPSGTLLPRFYGERQTLADLEHPNIVQLLDGGAVGGSPYFVMELIEGRPIGESFDGGRLGIRARVERFAKAVDAVAYAHGTGVLHRDLKPSNILVTPAGEPKLVDFGIAKLIDPARGVADGDQTRPEDRALTPAYASPAQVRGETPSVADDVYSLGVILYELLVGCRPYRVEGLSAYDAGFVVCNEEPMLMSARIPRPERTRQHDGCPKVEEIARDRGETAESLRRRLRGDLDAIVMKALHKDPKRRYETARSLLKDLENYLDDQPVTARSDTVGYRVNKFVRRRPDVAALTLALSLSVAGLVLGTLWSNGRLRVERTNALSAATKEKAARKVSQARLQIALEAMKTYHTGVGMDFLLQQEQFAGLRKTLLQSPRAFYKRLAESLEDGPKSETADREMLALAYSNQASVFELVGDQLEAEALHKRAYDIRQELALGNPGRRSLGSNLSITEVNIGRLQAENQRPSEGIAMIQKAIERLRQIAVENPDVSDYADTLQWAYVKLGNAQKAIGQDDEAGLAYRAALTISEQLVSAHPEDSQFRMNVVAAKIELGSVSVRTHQLSKAVDFYDQARRDIKEIGDKQPVDLKLRQNSGVIYSDLAVCYRALGDEAAAGRSDSQAVEVFEPLARDLPGSIEVQDQYAGSLVNYAIWMVENRKPEEALALYRRALDIQTRLSEDNPAKTAFRLNIASTYLNLGAAQVGAGRHAEAEKSYRTALGRFALLAGEHPEVAIYRYAQAGSLLNLADSLRESSNADPLPTCDDGIAVARELAKVQPNDPASQSLLGELLTSRAAALLRAKKGNAALDTLGEAMKLLTSAGVLSPQDVDIRQRLSRGSGELAKALWALTRESEAMAVSLKRLDLWQEYPDRLVELACELCDDPQGIIPRQVREDLALECLSRAVKAGYRDSAYPRVEKRLGSIRNTTRFRNLMNDLSFPENPFVK